MTSGLFRGDEAIPAWRAAEMSGSVRIAGDGGSAFGYALTEIRNGGRALFRSVCFDESAADPGPAARARRAFSVTARTDGPCRAELYLDGRYAGCVMIPPSPAFAAFRGTLERPVSGVCEAEIRFYGEAFTAALDEVRLCF